MPMMDFRCDVCGSIDETFYHPSEAKTERPMCCGQKMVHVQVGAPAVVWARPLSHYNEKHLEGADADAHVAWKIRSTTRPDGKPEKIIIDSRQKQLEYIKSEGLVDPMDARAVEPSSDGQRVTTQGNKNSWY